MDDFISKVNIWHVQNIWHLSNICHIPNRSLSFCLKEGWLSVGYIYDFLWYISDTTVTFTFTLGQVLCDSGKQNKQTNKNKTHDWPVHLESGKNVKKKKKKLLLFCNLAFVLTFELFHVKEYYTNHEIISNSSHVWCQ